LGVHKVYARVAESNEASMRVLEKLGFQQEGVLREQSYCLGEHLDMHYFGLPESER
jgi:RimJ/RimL family protein N-acetyltransferase